MKGLTVEYIIERLTLKRDYLNDLIEELEGLNKQNQIAEIAAPEPALPRPKLGKAKKIHWTQTPEGRAKMSKFQKDWAKKNPEKVLEKVHRMQKNSTVARKINQLEKATS